MTVRELFDFVVSDLDMIQSKLNTLDPLDSLSQENPTDEDILDAYLDKVSMVDWYFINMDYL